MSAGRLALLREEVSKAEFANELDESDGKLEVSIGPGLLPCVTGHFLDRRQNCGHSETPTCLGNFLGNRDYRISLIPMKWAFSALIRW